MKKGVLENFAKFSGKHLWYGKFLGTPFLQNTSATATLLEWGNANSISKTSDEYCLSRITNLRRTLEPLGISFLSRQHKLSLYAFIGLHSLLPEAATRVEVFCRKRCS